ncbi:MAG TPA: hypothetical protein VF929_02100 [Gemmatimonadaceae bacterium]
MQIVVTRAAFTAALCGVLAACHHASSTPPAPRPASPRAPATYASGTDVIAAMHDRYAGKWYTTITFTQKTSRLTAGDKWNVQTWYEAAHVPGRLRIDFDPISAGNGVIYARDSVFTVSGGRALPGQPSINPLLLLGFDVYGQSPARTNVLLRQEGFDLERVHAATFENRPMLVVGALAGDSRRKQFWIDAEHLYFVRLIEAQPRDTSRLQDIRFARYVRDGTAWVAPRVEIWTDGKLVFHEDYEGIRTNVPLDEALFDPMKWKTARHWITP